jgi:heat shock protein HslJ
MKTKNTSISLVLFLTIGIITIVSFSFGCTDQGENSSKPLENISRQTESIANTSEIVSNTTEIVSNTSETVSITTGIVSNTSDIASNTSESATNISQQPEPVEKVSSRSGSSAGISSQSGFSGGVSSESESSGDVSQRLKLSVDNISSIKWLWEGYSHFDSYTVVPDPENYILSFFSDGACYVKAECSSGNGSYTLDENNLTIDSTAITPMACGPDSMDPEYLGLLADIKSAAIEDGQLILYSSEGDVMYFSNGGQSER